MNFISRRTVKKILLLSVIVQFCVPFRALAKAGLIAFKPVPPSYPGGSPSNPNRPGFEPEEPRPFPLIIDNSDCCHRLSSKLDKLNREIERLNRRVTDLENKISKTDRLGSKKKCQTALLGVKKAVSIYNSDTGRQLVLDGSLSAINVLVKYGYLSVLPDGWQLIRMDDSGRAWCASVNE